MELIDTDLYIKLGNLDFDNLREYPHYYTNELNDKFSKMSLNNLCKRFFFKIENEYKPNKEHFIFESGETFLEPIIKIKPHFFESPFLFYKFLEEAVFQANGMGENEFILMRKYFKSNEFWRIFLENEEKDPNFKIFEVYEEEKYLNVKFKLEPFQNFFIENNLEYSEFTSRLKRAFEVYINDTYFELTKTFQNIVLECFYEIALSFIYDMQGQEKTDDDENGYGYDE